LKASSNVKISIQCFEIFGGGKCPKYQPSLLRACLKLHCDKQGLKTLTDLTKSETELVL